jgi:uncharacterized protein YndB with AHSA1/START domain
MREHRFSLDIPHPPERVWALFQRYDLWTQYAPMVVGVEVVHPGDGGGNGLLRRVIYKMPLGRRGSALELVTNVDPGHGYDYTMLSRRPGNDQTGRVELETLADGTTRLHFQERYNLTNPILRVFEAQIYRFINRQNEQSMRRASAWLSAHPEFDG